MAEWQPTIDGLELPQLGAGPGTASGIAQAALATVKALDEQKLLRPQDALTVQLVIELAQAIGRGLSFGKVTVATAQLTRQLIDAIDKLPQPVTDDGQLGAFDRLAQLILTGEPPAAGHPEAVPA